MNGPALRFEALIYLCNYLVAWLPSVRLRLFFYQYAMKVRCAPGVRILAGLSLDCRGRLSLGRNTVINQSCHLDARGGLSIGANVCLSPEVLILTADHDVYATDLPGRTRPVVVEDHVFVGSRAMILPGVTIGRGAAVAAAAVVTKSVPPRAVVAGVPARIIGERPTDLAYETSYVRHFI